MHSSLESASINRMTKLLREVQTGCGRKKVVCANCRKKRVCGFTFLRRFDEYNRKYDRNTLLTTIIVLLKFHHLLADLSTGKLI